MDKICKTLYDPLYDFCGPLHAAFPGLTPGFDRLVHCRDCSDWSLVHDLGPGCTKDLLLACLSRDETAFFKDMDNPFIGFIGGKVLYDRLVDTEREVFWGENRLANLVRQCMVLHALEPMTSKLQCIVSKLTSSTDTEINQSNVVSTLLTDPTMLSTVMGMMDSPESMKTLVSSLRTIVEGMLTECPQDTDDDVSEGTSDMCATTTEKVAEIDAFVSPGTFLKRENQKNAQKNKKKNKKTPSADLLSMLGELDLDDKEMADLSDDIKAMKTDEFSSIASEVTKMLGGEGGLDMQQMLQGLGTSGMDVSKMLGSLGGGDMQQMLQSLNVGGMDFSKLFGKSAQS